MNHFNIHSIIDMYYFSFISKVLIMLLNQRTTVLLEYIRNREGFIESFLRHLGTSAITDLLLQMIVPSDEDQSKVDVTTVSVHHIPGSHIQCTVHVLLYIYKCVVLYNV